MREDLHKGGIKMDSQEIVDYVMNTPHNTNPAILK
jgi:hypothetical protein